MTTSLYDATVGCFTQTLGAVAGFLDKGLAHCTEKGLDPAELIETRLYPDMAPFRFQVFCVGHHSLGAIEGVKAGAFYPPQLPPLDYAGLQKLVADARDALAKVTPDEVNALEGHDVIFHLGQNKMPFLVEGFLLSFSLPNFYFHATTAYDILRSQGAPLGKRDFLGPMRFKR